MRADGVRFRELLDHPIQYCVPLFQRPYSWEDKHWQQLWTDLEELYENGDGGTHFIGAVVTLPLTDSPEGASTFMLIDGQQRLTTLMVLLRVLEKEAERAGDAFLQRRLNETYLTNLTRREDVRFKLLPTQGDRAAFLSIMQDDPVQGGSRLHDAARFFAQRYSEGDTSGSPLNLERVINAVIGGLELVSVKLEKQDSPHRIFESLNNTGMPLSAADLIRNHIFMCLEPGEQERVYETAWRPLEKGLGTHLTGFFWRFLMMTGELPRWDAVYSTMRVRLSKVAPQDMGNFVAGLRDLGQTYRRIVDPAGAEPDPHLRKAMIRLNTWELETSYPYLLRLYQAADGGLVTVEDCRSILKALESYAVRRLVCGIPTNRLRRIFAKAAAEFTADKALQQCEGHLAANEWPSDERFRESFISFQAYVSSRLGRLRMILASLESSFGHKEPADPDDGATIEHIMPQTLTPEWKEMLGAQWAEEHDKWLHTIGNLTFSGYNVELGNRPFEEKRRILADSHFELNKGVLSRDTWDASAIGGRARELGERSLLMWKRPTPLPSADSSS